MSNWREDEIWEHLALRAEADIVRQIQGTKKDSAIYGQLTKRLCNHGVICIMSCLLHALPRGQTSPKANVVFPVTENASDTDNLWLCALRLKGEPDNVWTCFSEKTA